MSRAKQNKNPSTSSSRDESKSEQRKNRRALRHAVDSIDWSAADPQRIKSAVVAVTREGCAIQFSTTKDGSTLVVRIIGDADEPYNEYVRPSEDVDLYLQGLCEDFSN